jgi:sugar phosphate isomerase/epimerase
MSQISVQLYSLRDDCKSDLAGTLKKVAKLGYDAVEFAGLHDHAPAAVRKMLDDTALKVSGAHIHIDQFDDANFEKTVDLCKTVGITNAIVPWLDPSLRDSPDACKRTAKRFMAIAKKLAPHQIRTGFHMHDADVKPLFDPAAGRVGRKSAWELFCEITPASFIMQHDTGNAMHGGADPLWTLQHFPTRCQTVHFKEFPLDGCAIGEGQVPWKQVIQHCRKAKTQWYVVEHERYDRYPPLKAVDVALTNLKKVLAELPA